MGSPSRLLCRFLPGIAPRVATISVAALTCFFTPKALLALPEPVVVSDSASVAATVAAYHRALAAGDSTAALALLAEDAIILESGEMESRAEYRSHHLVEDIAFSRAVPGTRGGTRVVVSGDVAWATTSSVTEGKFKGRPVKSTDVELMVLSRSTTSAGAVWQIRAIHWSSRRRA